MLKAKHLSRLENDRLSAKQGAIEQAALGTTAAVMALGLIASESDPARAAAAPQSADHRSDHAGPLHAAPPTADHAPSDIASAPASHAAAPGDQPDSAPPVAMPEPVTLEHSPAAGSQADSSAIPVEPTSVTTPASVQSPAAAEPAHENPAVTAHDPAPLTLPDLPPLHADTTALHDAVGGLGANMASMVTTTLDAALAVPALAAGHLVDAVFQPALPTMAVDTPLIDATPLVGALALPPPLTLGFMGQAHPDGQDAHDGAFTAHHV